MSQPEPESEAAPETEPEVYPETQAEPEVEIEPEGPAEPEGEMEPEGHGEPEGVTEPVPLSEFSSNQERDLWISLYSICMFLIVTGDILIIITILKNRHLRRKPSNLYLLSLIFARTMIGILVVPTRITSTFSEDYLTSVACKLCHLSALGSSSTSIISVVAVAVDKYKELISKKNTNTPNPTQSPQQDGKEKRDGWAEKVTGSEKDIAKQKPQSDDEEKVRRKEDKVLQRTYLTLLFMWTLGHIYAIRAYYLNDMVELDQGDSVLLSCTLIPDKGYLIRWFTLLDFICLFIMPLCTITYCYIKVIRKNLMKTKDGGPVKDEATRQTIKQSLKTSQMLVVVMALFILCNLPPYILRLMVSWGDANITIGVTLEQAMYLASYSNSWLNVFVYLVYRKDLRDGLWALFSCGCARKNKVQVIEPSPADKMTKF